LLSVAHKRQKHAAALGLSFSFNNRGCPHLSAA